MFFLFVLLTKTWSHCEEKWLIYKFRELFFCMYIAHRLNVSIIKTDEHLKCNRHFQQLSEQMAYTYDQQGALLLFRKEKKLPVCCSECISECLEGEKNHYSLTDGRKLQWSVLILWLCPGAWPLPLCPCAKLVWLYQTCAMTLKPNVEAPAQHCPVCLPISLYAK